MIGTECFRAVAASAQLRKDMRALDYGCGIGRTSIPMADFLADGELIGVDIVPGMVEFCQNEIHPIYPNTTFILSSSDNPLYTKYKSKSPIIPQDINEWSVRAQSSFDLIYAFSVFTHLDPEMAQSTFDLFVRVLKPSGFVFVTAFLDLVDNPPR